MEDKILVGLNDSMILDNNNPVGYARDISTCMVILVHRKNSSTLMHVESYDNRIELDVFLESMKPDKDNPIISVDIFTGNDTTPGNLSIIQFVLHRYNIPYTVRQIFRNNSNETSVGYNFLTKEYYMARMHDGKPILTRKRID